MGEKIASVATAIVGVAMVATFTRNANGARAITAAGNAFSQALRAAQGR